jgi:hypothetical protein
MGALVDRADKVDKVDKANKAVDTTRHRGRVVETAHQVNTDRKVDSACMVETETPVAHSPVEIREVCLNTGCHHLEEWAPMVWARHQMECGHHLTVWDRRLTECDRRLTECDRRPLEWANRAEDNRTECIHRLGLVRMA